MSKPNLYVIPPAARPKHSQVQKANTDWLTEWLKNRKLTNEVRAVWDAWPPLETATLKLARLFGPELLGPDQVSIVGTVVARATLAFRTKKVSGAPTDRAAKLYLDALLECGELVVSNRVEAEPESGRGRLMVWDPSVDRYEDWCASLPPDYEITTHTIRVGDGEYAAGRSMIAALILSPAEYARIFYGHDCDSQRASL